MCELKVGANHSNVGTNRPNLGANRLNLGGLVPTGDTNRLDSSPLVSLNVD